MRAGGSGAEAAPVRRLDALAPAGCPIASSSSFMPASRLAADCPAAPAASSSIRVTRPTCCGWPRWCRRRSPPRRPSSAPRRLLRGAGIAPIRVAREVEGFVFNRLQGAVLREAYCLVRDGVATVADIDRAGARRARPALGGDRAVRDRRPQHARRHRGPRRTHGAGLCADGGRAGPGRSVDAGAGRRGGRAAPGGPAARRLGRARRLARPDADGAAAGAARPAER